MQAVTTIGFDIAKSVFQVHGVDSVGQVIIRRQLKRRQVIAFFQKQKRPDASSHAPSVHAPADLSDSEYKRPRAVSAALFVPVVMIL